MSHLNLSPIQLRRLRRPAPGRAQSGFSLLEALVSIVILSFGLLGVAGLQASSLKYTRDASNQSIAVNLARELAEMIRSNARASGRADNPYLMDVTVLDIPKDEVPDTCLKSDGGCPVETDPDEFGNNLAEAQIADWQYRVSQALPGARVAVCMDETPYYGDNDNQPSGTPKWECSDSGSIIAIKMGWDRDNTSGNPAAAEDLPPYVIFPVTPAGQQ